MPSHPLITCTPPSSSILYVALILACADLSPSWQRRLRISCSKIRRVLSAWLQQQGGGGGVGVRGCKSRPSPACCQWSDRVHFIHLSRQTPSLPIHTCLYRDLPPFQVSVKSLHAQPCRHETLIRTRRGQGSFCLVPSTPARQPSATSPSWVALRCQRPPCEM